MRNQQTVGENFDRQNNTPFDNRPRLRLTYPPPTTHHCFHALYRRDARVLLTLTTGVLLLLHKFSSGTSAGSRRDEYAH